MVGRDGNPDIAEPAFDVFIKPGEKSIEIGIERVYDFPLYVCVRPYLVAENIGTGDAEGEHVRHIVLAELLAGDQSLREVKLIADAGWRAADFSFKISGVGQVGFLLGLIEPAACVEGRSPVGKLRHVIGGSGEDARCFVDPEGSVCGSACGQNGSTIFEGYAEDLGCSFCIEPQL